MALVLADRVQETSTTSGTGTFTLAGAVSGFKTFSSAIGNGNTVYYVAYDQIAYTWELGIGTTGAGTLSRDTILSNSSGNTSKINFTGNTINIWCDYPATKAVFKDASDVVTVPTLTTSTRLNLAVWTTAGRPAAPVAGTTGFNSTDSTIEFYDGTNWIGTNLIPTINSISGSIIVGSATTLTIGVSKTTNTFSVVFTRSGVTLATVTGVTQSGGSASVAVPSTVYNVVSAGNVVVLSLVNANGTVSSNTQSTTVISYPTGGTIVTSGGYRYHTFTSSGTFTVYSGYTPSIQTIVVAGGAGGGTPGQGSGGGGAGGFRYSSLGAIGATSYTVTVGGGGGAGGNGGGSSFSSASATGGGTGGTFKANGSGGGSGGGAGRDGGSGGAGTSGQGNNGGYATAGSCCSGSGGGGAGAAGANGVASDCGPAAAGRAGGGSGTNSYSSWASATGTGASGYYAGGGGGAWETGGPTPGGAGGGGYGGYQNQGGAGSGTANTGGGGGGGHYGCPAGSGGSGIVIIRYAFP